MTARLWIGPAEWIGQDQGSWSRPQDLVRQACAGVVRLAADLKLPLVMEQLDFAGRQAGLACGEHSRRARMLSSFPCTRFTASLGSTALRDGVHLQAVNQAYTSLIGRVSYASRYGLRPRPSARRPRRSRC